MKYESFGHNSEVYFEALVRNSEAFLPYLNIILIQ